MSALLDRLGLELPIVQAGMGGGLAGAELAAAVSGAGGLGTVGIDSPERLRAALRDARERTDRPLAVNLLLPFARAAHWDATAGYDAVVTFWGRPRRHSDAVWIHQCGSPAEAVAAHRAGADAVIAQGVEAGGHVRGTTPALDLIGVVRAALPAGYPVLLAGGIATAADVRECLEAGADAAVLGTRFLMTEESGAHELYKRRLVEARSTVLTELFGAGWPGAPHRVLRNAAVERWTRRDVRGPVPVRAVNRLSGRLMARMPAGLQETITMRQTPSLPMFGPRAPVRGAPEKLLDASALYAGETVARIEDLRPAAELVRELTH
jgi:NAD(P)H-dependent flavin oxidoreductase YrpB (nitropropane dioxygenase family)